VHQSSQPAPAACCAVREERGGWRVTLMPGDHPRIDRPATFWGPPGAAGPSPDGRFHFCGVPSTARCFLAPIGTN